MDYTEQNLWYDAIGYQWPTLVGTAATAITPAADVRDDRPLGYGPAPATYIMAEQFNQLAAAINLLTRYRVMLPHTIELRDVNYLLDTEVEAKDPDGDAASCVSSGAQAAYWAGTPPESATGTPDSWGTWNHPSVSATILSPDCGSGGKFVLRTSRNDVELRLVPTGSALYCIPPNWADMLDTDIAVLATTTASRTVDGVNIVASGGSGCCYVYEEPCPGFWSRSDGNYLEFTSSAETDPAECGIVGPGIFSADALAAQVLAIGRSAAGAECNSTVTNHTLVALFTDTAMLVVPLTD
jgi:hypothetical protein